MLSRRLRWNGWAWGLLLELVPQLTRAASAPLAWSYDGAWISYVVETPVTQEPLRTGWIFEPPQEKGSGFPERAVDVVAPSRISRLWATKLGTSTSVLLEETSGTIGPPNWSSDGHSLAFSRVTSTTPGRGLFEIVIVEGVSRRTVYSHAIEDWGHDTARLAQAFVTWSPDGRFLTIPQVKPAGLAILRVDTGRVIKSIEGGTRPVWAPDGGRLLYVSSGDEDRLECLDTHFGASRHLADLGQVDSPPIFVRDGLSAIILTRKRIERGAFPPAEQVDLWRVRLDDGHKERITTLGTTARDQVLSATALTQDRDGENIYASMTIRGQPSQVTWFRPRERSVHKKFPILDEGLGIEDLNLSPLADTLALRLVTPGTQGLPILCNLDTMQLTPLAPDTATRMAWTACLLTSLENLLRELRPTPIVAGRAIDRPVALPMPDEIDKQRVRRLGRLGHDLLAMGKLEGGNEATLLFDYLREDYPAAMTDLDAIDPSELNPDRRLRMLNLRAQILVGMGDFEQARGTLDYLKTIESSRKRRLIETTSQGVSLSDIPSPDAGWSDYAKQRLAAIEHAAALEDDAGRSDVTEHRNPDAPQPGLGLELELPAIPRRGFPLAPLPELRPTPRFPVMPNQRLRPGDPPF